MPLPGVRCSACLYSGQEIWVIPGRSCGFCGTPCDYSRPAISSQRKKPKETSPERYERTELVYLAKVEDDEEGVAHFKGGLDQLWVVDSTGSLQEIRADDKYAFEQKDDQTFKML